MASNRLIFLDLLRGGAALVMIEVHVVNAFLQASYRDASWFPALNYVNGLVAPAFLFAAGFAFALTSERAERSGVGDRRGRVMKNLRRIGLVLASGYLLHLPGFGWSKLATVSDAGWLRFVQVDILHTIAVGLLVLLFAREFLGGVKGLIRTAASVGIVCWLVAPWAWTWDAQAVLPSAIAAFVNGTPYSQFPLFPWLAFLMAGAVTAAIFPKGDDENARPLWARRIGWVGVVLVAVAGALRWSEAGLYMPDVHIRANPWFVAERIGVMFVLLWGLTVWGGRMSREPFVLRDVSRESLQVYVFHLMIIYGDWIDGSSFAFHYKQRFDLLPVIGITLLLMSLMVGTAWTWQYWKRVSPKSVRPAFLAAVAVGMIVYFLR